MSDQCSRVTTPITCISCGVVHDNARDLPGVNELMASRDETVENLLAEKAKAARRITWLERERSDRRANPFAQDAQRVFDHWRAKLSPRAREFNGKRQAVVIARLEAGHSVEELCRAIDGAALLPYVTEDGRSAHGRPDQRHVKLETICGDEDRLDRFKSYVEVEEAPGQPESSERPAPAAGTGVPSPAPPEPPEPEWPTFDDWVDQAMDRRRALIEGLTPDPVVLERRSFLLAHVAGFWRERKGAGQLRLAA